jgi:hypothetical protein
MLTVDGSVAGNGIDDMPSAHVMAPLALQPALAGRISRLQKCQSK